MKNAYLAGVALVPIILALSPAQSFAAQSTAAAVAAPADAAAPALDEVVVVARRTEERLQDVPISVVAVSANELRTASITRSSDLVNLVPSLSVGEASTGPTNSFSIRGIRTGVVTYFADVPTSSAAVNDQLWDMNSVQALAGPQGTLFGRNSTGGAVLFVPQRPTDKLEGFIEGGYGNYNAERFTGALNVPVAPGLDLRFGAQIIRRDGIVKNTLGPDAQSQDRNAFRASLLFHPGDGRFTDYAVADYSERNEVPNAFITSGATSPTIGCFAGIGCSYGPGSRFGGPAINTLQALQTQLGVREIASSFPDTLKSRDYGVSNTAQFKFNDSLSVKYIFGYRSDYQYVVSNQTHLDLPIEIIQNSNKPTPTYTNEIQLLGKGFDNRLNIVVGAFFLNQKGGQNINSTSLYGDPSLPFSLANNIDNISQATLDSQGYYTQATFTVIDGLDLTAGVRYNQDKRSQTTNSVGPEFTFFGPTACRIPAGTPGLDAANCILNQSAVDTATTYNFSIDYHLSKAVMVYATTRRGYNQGGFNTGIPATTDPTAPQQSFGPEFLTDYEGGVKADWHLGNMPARTDIAAYLGKYDGVQRLTRGVTADGVPFQGTANGGKATIYGVQFESSIRPMPELTVNLNYGFLHTQYDVGTPIFPKGNAFAQAPEHTLNLSAVYTHPVQPGGDLVASAGLTYSSQIAFNDSNFGAPNDFQKAYSLVDARLGWNRVAGSNVDVDVFVKNLFNTLYAQDLQDQSAIFGISTLWADPRTFGVEARYTFGR